MARFRLNFMSGIVTTDGGSTLSDTSSPSSFAQLPTIVSGSGDYMPLVINPGGVLGNLVPDYSPEVVYVVGHGTNSNTVTVIRECEGTITPSGGWDGASWIHSYTRDDYPINTNLVTNGDFIGGGTAAGWDPSVIGSPDLGHWVANPSANSWTIAADQNDGSGWVFSSTGAGGYQQPPFFQGGSKFGSPQSAYVTLNATSAIAQATLASNLFPVFPGEVIEVTGFVWLGVASGTPNAAALVSIAQSTSNTTYTACATTTLAGTPAYHLGTVPVAVEGVGTNGAWVPFCVTTVINGTDAVAATVVLQAVSSATGSTNVGFAHIETKRLNANQTKLPGAIEPYTGIGGYIPLGYVLAQNQTLASSAIPTVLQQGASYGNFYNHVGAYSVFDGAGRNFVGTGTSTSSSNTYTPGSKTVGGLAGTETVLLDAAHTPLPSHDHTVSAITGSVGTSINIGSLTCSSSITSGSTGTGFAQLSDPGHTHTQPPTTYTFMYFTYLGNGIWGPPPGGEVFYIADPSTPLAYTGIFDEGHSHDSGDFVVSSFIGGSAALNSGTVTIGGHTDNASAVASEAFGNMAPFNTLLFLVKV